MTQYLQAARQLAEFTIHRHWTGKALIGPDPGVRFNSRIWRFFKSYLQCIDWKDDRYFLQCQGYWIRNMWTLFKLTGEDQYRRIAMAATKTVLRQQKPEGFWEYPLPEWRGRIATVDGNYAALGLLATYHETRNERMLEGVIRWYRYLINEIGFQEYRGTRCINYFAHLHNDMVPNNNTLTLELLGELYHETQKKTVLEHCREMVRFLKMAQLENGELPYAFDWPGARGRTHFLCYQYNCFQFIDLAAYWEFTKDPKINEVIKPLIRYIQTGITADGHAKYNCFKAYPEVTYYTAVIAAALLRARQIGLGDFSDLENHAFQRVLQRQQPGGGFIYSTRNYGFLHDKRSYPRYLAMILRHLLMKAQAN
ncbi:hypothetical protein JW835_09285 [bacterium]|nr:hypothetical protein [bacterium]